MEEVKKRGRPATGRSKPNLFQVRMSDEELQRAQHTATQLGKSLNQLIRETLMSPLTPSPVGVAIQVQGYNFTLTRPDAIKLLLHIQQQLIGD